MSNGRVMIIHLIAGLTKNTFYKNSQYFPKRYKPFDLSNYVTKANLKMQQGLILLILH